MARLVAEWCDGAGGGLAAGGIAGMYSGAGGLGVSSCWQSVSDVIGWEQREHRSELREIGPAPLRE